MPGCMSKSLAAKDFGLCSSIEPSGPGPAFAQLAMRRSVRKLVTALPVSAEVSQPLLEQSLGAKASGPLARMSRPSWLKAPVLDFEVLASFGLGRANSVWRKPMRMGNDSFPALRDASAAVVAERASTCG